MTADVYATTVLGYPPLAVWVAYHDDARGLRWYAAGLNEAGHADHWSREIDDALGFPSRYRAVRAVAQRGGGVTKR